MRSDAEVNKDKEVNFGSWRQSCCCPLVAHGGELTPEPRKSSTSAAGSDRIERRAGIKIIKASDRSQIDQISPPGSSISYFKLNFQIYNITVNNFCLLIWVESVSPLVVSFGTFFSCSGNSYVCNRSESIHKPNRRQHRIPHAKPSWPPRHYEFSGTVLRFPSRITTTLSLQ